MIKTIAMNGVASRNKCIKYPLELLLYRYLLMTTVIIIGMHFEFKLLHIFFVVMLLAVHFIYLAIVRYKIVCVKRDAISIVSLKYYKRVRVEYSFKDIDFTFFQIKTTLRAEPYFSILLKDGTKRRSLLFPMGQLIELKNLLEDTDVRVKVAKYVGEGSML